MADEPIENVKFIHGHHYPEMIKETLSEIKKRKIKIKEGDLIKSRFSGEKGTEWMWIRVIGLSEDKILGKLDNIPVLVEEFEYGQVVKVDPNFICGYYSKDGKIGVNPLKKAIEK